MPRPVETFIIKTLQAMTPGAWGIWVLVLYFIQDNARQRLADRKLSLEDRQANREGFTKQLASVQGENRELRRELSEQREAFDDFRAEAHAAHAALQKEYDGHREICFAETQQLRKDVLELENAKAGLERRIAAIARIVARRFNASLDDLLEQ